MCITDMITQAAQGVIPEIRAPRNALFGIKETKYYIPVFTL